MVDILVVDDTEALLETYCNILSRMGHQVFKAENGASALEMIASREFDLIFTDQEMPQLRGTDLILEIRRLGKKMPIILASGNTFLHDDNSIDPQAWQEIFAFLQKPIENAVLKETITKALNPNG